MNTQRHLLFDLDGTLSDPLEGIAKSINYALKAFGYEQRQEPVLAKYIGPPIDKTFSELADTDDSDHILALVAKFRERFGDKGYKENKLYPNIRQTLESLHEKKIPMGVCTSKREDFAKRIIDMFDLTHLFEFISGGDVGISKGQQINRLLNSGKIGTNAVMIGDRDVDIRAAHENGLDGFGVLWGYGSRKELEAADPKGVFKQPCEMIELAES